MREREEEGSEGRGEEGKRGRKTLPDMGWGEKNFRLLMSVYVKIPFLNG